MTGGREGSGEAGLLVGRVDVDLLGARAGARPNLPLTTAAPFDPTPSALSHLQHPTGPCPAMSSDETADPPAIHQDAASTSSAAEPTPPEQQDEQLAQALRQLPDSPADPAMDPASLSTSYEPSPSTPDDAQPGCGSEVRVLRHFSSVRAREARCCFGTRAEGRRTAGEHRRRRAARLADAGQARGQSSQQAFAGLA